MNILILNWRDTKHPKSGGAEAVTMEYAKWWVRMGHEVTWFTSGYKGAKKEESIENVRIIRQAGSQTVYLLAPLYLLFHSHEYDLIVDEVHGIPFFSALFTHKPIVVFIHEIAGDIWNFMYHAPISGIGKCLEEWYLRLYRNKLFLTDAKSTAEELVERGIKRNQITVIHCPIPSFTRFMAAEVKEKKEKKPTFIFVSRIVKMKGIEEVVKAFAFIQRELPSSQLWIVGGGDEGYVIKIQTMIREYGISDRVTWFGRLNEKEKLAHMAKAHLLLHASVKEGWGLVVLEAGFLYTPSVVYNVPGLRDVVRDGNTGVVVSDNSPLELARSSVCLYQDTARYKKYQTNAHNWAESLTWNTAGKKSEALLQKAMKSHTV
jgi:glycosyltransferase involved in cell wall biosynthesis